MQGMKTNISLMALASFVLRANSHSLNLFDSMSGYMIMLFMLTSRWTYPSLSKTSMMAVKSVTILSGR